MIFPYTLAVLWVVLHSEVSNQHRRDARAARRRDVAPARQICDPRRAACIARFSLARTRRRDGVFCRDALARSAVHVRHECAASASGPG